MVVVAVAMAVLKKHTADMHSDQVLGQRHMTPDAGMLRSCTSKPDHRLRTCFPVCTNLAAQRKVGREVDRWGRSTLCSRSLLPPEKHKCKSLHHRLQSPKTMHHNSDRGTCLDTTADASLPSNVSRWAAAKAQMLRCCPVHWTPSDLCQRRQPAALRASD